MHNLLILGDNSINIIEPYFVEEFVNTYWNNIALVIPVVYSEEFYEETYFDLINRGHTVDWLFAIVPNLNHPLDVDWIFIKPRQAHPWGYGAHPATSNFNGGGSTACFQEILKVVEALAQSERVQKYCHSIPKFYEKNPPQTFELLYLYNYTLLKKARCLADTSLPSFDDLYDKKRDIDQTMCLGLYGCSDATLSMQWKVQSLRSDGFWMSTTTELADQVTLALRLSGESDHYTKVPTSYAFEKWMSDLDDYEHKREPLLIRYADDVLFCQPPVLTDCCWDAYFLDCVNQEIKRLGRNGGDPKLTLEAWNINSKDNRLQFLFS